MDGSYKWNGGKSCPQTSAFQIRQRLVNTQQIPGDGNCLFGAIIHQLHGITPESPNYSTTIDHLQREVAEHIENHAQQYMGQILDSVRTSFGTNNIIHRLPPPAQVQQYKQNLRRRGLWGGAEVTAAVTEIHHVQ